MNAIKVELPESVINRINELSLKDNQSINHFIELAVFEKISALEAVDYLEKRGKKSSKIKYHKALSKVSKREPEDYDKL